MRKAVLRSCLFSVLIFCCRQAAYPQATAAVPRLECTEPVFDFGILEEEETVRHAFILRNNGQAPALIKRVYTSCGCTAAAVIPDVIPPGGEARIETVFKLRGRRGPQNQSITVESDDPAAPRLVLRLKGVIELALDMDPRHLNFRQVHQQEEVALHARLVSAFPGARILRVDSDSPYFAAAADDDGLGLTVRTVPPLAGDYLRAVLTVYTDHPGSRPLQMEAAAAVVGDLIVVPREIQLRLADREPQRRIVLVRPSRGAAFTLIGIEPPQDGLPVSVRALDGGGFMLTLDGLTAENVADGSVLVIRTSLASMPELRVPIRIVP